MNWRAAAAAQRLPDRRSLRDNRRATRSGRDSKSLFRDPALGGTVGMMRIVIAILLFESLREYGA